MQSNYFAAETSIVERLKDQVSGIKAVYTPFSTADMVEASQHSPAMHVIYGGDSISGNEAGNGAHRTVDQRWLVVLAVRTAKAQLQDTTDARVLAGEIIPQILQALQGWKAEGMQRPLVRVSAPPVGYSATFAYFPFMFEGRMLT